MELSTAIETYATARDLRPATLAGYRLAIRSLSAWLGRPATAGDLTAETLNRWSRSLRESAGLSPYSIATYRRGILVLSRDLARRGLADRPDAHDLAPIRCPPTPRVVWSAAEVRRLVESLERFDDEPIRDFGVRWRAWWRSAILAAWDSALRWSDLGRLTHAEIPANGVLRIVQTKTGVEHVVRFRRETLDAIAAVRTSPTARVWPTPYPTWRHKQLRRILRVAGLVGTLQQLRRSSITAAELDRPGSGHVLAGHTTPATTFRWYVPRTALIANPPAPPALENPTMDRTTDRLDAHEAPGGLRHRLRIGERFEIHAAAGMLAEIDVRRDPKRNATELVIRSNTPLRIVRRG